MRISRSYEKLGCKCDRFVFIMHSLNLHHPTTASPPNAMIVCVCHRVSDREIARHARAGLSFDDIQFELGVATQCGRCEGCARDVVAQCSVMHPMASLHREAPCHSLSSLAPA